MVTVPLSVATEEFNCMLDGKQLLPQSWSEVRPQRAAAGIPEAMVYCPKWRKHARKWQIALEQLDRSAGVMYAWITADEGYGRKPGFLEGLHERGKAFVLEVPRSLSVWEKTLEINYGPKLPKTRPRALTQPPPSDEN